MPGRASLLLFSKAPRAGRVMTRLCPPLTPAGAAGLYRALVRRTLDTAGRSGLSTCLYGREEDAWLRAQARAGRIPMRLQQGRDLGERMHHAVAQSLATGTRAAIVIGCDCPGLSPELLSGAGRILAAARSDLVLGPACDGGYYLIGMSRARGALFADVPWGTGDVLRITLRRAASLGLGVHLLPRLADIDRPADLSAYPWPRPC